MGDGSKEGVGDAGNRGDSARPVVEAGRYLRGRPWCGLSVGMNIRISE